MWTIRSRLAVVMILALAPPMAVLSLVTTNLMRATLQHQADVTLDYVTTQNTLSINRDLSHLAHLLDERTRRLEQAVTAAVAEGIVGDLIAQERYREAGSYLTSALDPAGASMITVVNRAGVVAARASNPGAYGDHLAADPDPPAGVTRLGRAVQAAWDRPGVRGMLLLAPAALERERVTASSAIAGVTAPGDPLARQAQVTASETRGLAAAALVPVPDRQGTIRGVALAARLLNWDREVAQAHHRETEGFMAICLGEVVVAGDLPTVEGRAVGQTLSRAFADPVLRQGKQRWTGRLESTGVQLNGAARALQDLERQVVGLIVAAAPVTELQRVVDEMQAEAARVESRSLLILLAWLVVGVTIAFASAMLAARGLLTPIRQLRDGARRIGEGDLSHRLRVRGGDELEQLANDFNQMAQRLQQARDEERLALIGRMASTIVHDIQNALTTIRGSLPLLAEDDLPAGQRQEFAAMLVESVQRIADMARDLLDFARGQPAALELRELSVDQYLEQLRPHLERELRDSPMRLVFLPDCPHRVRIDPPRMNRVIFNLAANARDASGDGGTFTITTRCERGYAEIRCSDTGPGIPPEMEGRLFEPFSSFGKPYGTGLGLVISSKTVEAHGGTIEARPDRPHPPGAAVEPEPAERASPEGADSKPAPRGATFIIRLPLADDAASV